MTEQEHIHEAWRLINEVLDDFLHETGCSDDSAISMLRAIADVREQDLKWRR